MTTTLIIVTVFIGVTALAAFVGLMLRGNTDDAVANRLDALARNRPTGPQHGGSGDESNLLAGPLDDMPGLLESSLLRLMNLRLLLEQADVSISPAKFVIVVVVLGVGGELVSTALHLHLAVGPLLGLVLAAFPIGWLLLKRKRRLAAFAKQLPEALDLIARALRAGHSLQAGFHLVGDEMADPIGTEFTRVFEEQNLGIPLEEALDTMSDRVPNLDLRFFATAIILQRQTGGDLAEILDKIGNLIRERFTIHGQIQALTGEGRLSGIVLLSLPPALFLFLLSINYDYAMVLFTDPMGKKMLAATLVFQLIGALVIRKIVNIKV